MAQVIKVVSYSSYTYTDDDGRQVRTERLELVRKLPYTEEEYRRQLHCADLHNRLRRGSTRGIQSVEVEEV